MDTHEISQEEAEIILGYDENHFRDLKAKEVAPAKLKCTAGSRCVPATGWRVARCLRA